MPIFLSKNDKSSKLYPKVKFRAGDTVVIVGLLTNFCIDASVKSAFEMIKMLLHKEMYQPLRIMYSGMNIMRTKNIGKYRDTWGFVHRRRQMVMCFSMELGVKLLMWKAFLKGLRLYIFRNIPGRYFVVLDHHRMLFKQCGTEFIMNGFQLQNMS